MQKIELKKYGSGRPLAAGGLVLFIAPDNGRRLGCFSRPSLRLPTLTIPQNPISILNGLIVTTAHSLSPLAKTAGGYLTLLAALAAFMPATATAAKVSGGSLILNLDRDALAASIALDATAAPSIYLEEFFDAEAAATRTNKQLLEDHLVAGVDEIQATGLEFAVNGPTVSNPQGRNSQPTTLTFNPDDLAGSVTGAVGFGGAARFRIDTGTQGNRVLSGDYTLEYDAANIDPSTGRSGWTLYNHLYYRADAFYLFNVVTDLTTASLLLSGDLGLGSSFNHLGGSTNAIVGNFSFQTSLVPVPAAAWLFMSGLAGLGLLGRARGTTG